MRRSIKYPALLIGAPQGLLGGFYLLMRAVGVPWDVRAVLYCVGSGVALVITTIISGIGLFGEYHSKGWLMLDEEDIAKRAAKHEEEMRRLDESIGIPRIPVRK